MFCYRIHNIHNYIKNFFGCLGLKLFNVHSLNQFNVPLFFKINKMQKIF